MSQCIVNIDKMGDKFIGTIKCHID